MSALNDQHCRPCEGGMSPLTRAAAEQQLQQLAAGWQLSEDGRNLRREYQFVDFYRTMSFLNALAHIANIEDHHPDLELGYNYLRVRYTTHAIGGLSDNDFICAAKLDTLAAK